MGNAQSTTRSANATVECHDLDPERTLVTAFAAALRNIAVYPADHPRVVSAATSCLAQFTGLSGGQRTVVVALRGDFLVVDGRKVPAGEGLAAWLVHRLRTAGLRGVAVEPTCTTVDLIAFAAALNRARAPQDAAGAAAWPADHPRLRPLDLVFAGAFLDAGESPDDEAGDQPIDPVDEPADPAVRAQRRRVLDHLAADRKIRQRLVAIELGCAAAGSGTERDVDLLAAVAAMLPANVANQPERIAEVVDTILAQVERELPPIVRGSSEIAGADLLRTAVGIARRYFHTKATAPRAPHLPSGRPEDGCVQADLPALLQELDALPDRPVPMLPPATQLEADHPQMATELLGIHLHTFVSTGRAEVRQAVRERLVRCLAELDGNRRAVLAAYLGRRHQPAPCGENVRLQLLTMLVEAGQTQLLRDLEYVDAAFIARSFPESLRLAARVLGRTPEDLTILRDGLAAIGPMLALGGADAAAKSGVLQDAAVVETLLAVGGSCVLPLLPHLAHKASAEVQRRLCAYLGKLQLPAAEAAAVTTSVAPLSLPTTYLHDLLRAASLGRFDAALRTATGELLRRNVLQGLERLPTPRVLDLVAALRHAPGPETTELLQQLAARNRLAVFDQAARALRRCASDVLAQLTQPSR
jgi:hypothetical protein